MVRLIEKYLTEDIDAVRKQYPDIDDDLFYAILRMDPTYREGSNSVGKYGKWLLTSYKKDATTKSCVLNRPEIVQKILRTYDQYKNDRTKEIEKDISRFSGLDDMAVAVDNAREADLSKKQLQRQAKKDKAYDMVFEGNTYAIFVPQNHAGDMVLASFGGSSKAIWCTAADSENGIHMYDKYIRESGGKYYVLINKKNYEDKYQFHFESNQFRDKDNSQIDLEDFFETNIDVKEFFESEGYDVEKYYLRIPETDEGQVDMIEEWLDGYDYDWIEWIAPSIVFGAIENNNGMDLIEEHEYEYFYYEDEETQFELLQSVGLMSKYDSLEEYREKGIKGIDISDWVGEYISKYLEMYDSVSGWIEDMYGKWDKISYRTRKDIIDTFNLSARDVAKYVVYDKMQGYEWCAEIVDERRENEF